MNRLRSTSLLAALAFAPLATASAQTVIVTTPPVKTVAGARESDPFATDTWLRNNVGGGGSVGVSADFPRSGNGSAYMASTSGASKADFEYFFGGSVISPFSLGSLTGASFDFYRAGTSTTAAHFHPSLRFFVDADGDLGTATDRGYLIYEGIYNGAAVAPTDAWTTATIGGSTNLWFRQFTPGQTETVYNRSLADYQAGTYTPTAGFLQINGGSVVYGVSTGVGSGWNGTFEGAVDNVRLQYGAGNDVTFNYEVAAVPEPSTYVLMASGLAVLGGLAARRRKQA